MKNKIKSDIRRFKKFQSMVTDKNNNIDVNDVDIRNYAKIFIKRGRN